MFFLHELERTISLHPSFFGPKNNEYLIQQLMNDIEGKNTGSYFVVCVMDSIEFSDPRVVPGKAYAEYTLHFKAVVWKPFKGEIVSRKSDYSVHNADPSIKLDGIVTSVVESGFFIEIGPLSVFVAKTVSNKNLLISIIWLI
jgi:DNA-directed RNA polymerase II subunit RPB7